MKEIQIKRKEETFFFGKNEKRKWKTLKNQKMKKWTKNEKKWKNEKEEKKQKTGEKKVGKKRKRGPKGVPLEMGPKNWFFT